MKTRVEITPWYGLGSSEQDHSYPEENVESRHSLSYEFAYVLEKHGHRLEGWLSRHRSSINYQIRELFENQNEVGAQEPRAARRKLLNCHETIRKVLKETYRLSPDRRPIEDEVHFTRLWSEAETLRDQWIELHDINPHVLNDDYTSSLYHELDWMVTQFVQDVEFVIYQAKTRTSFLTYRSDDVQELRAHIAALQTSVDNLNRALQRERSHSRK